MLPFRPRCCLEDRLKAVAYGVEVVALQLTQGIAHANPGYGKLSRLPEGIRLVGFEVDTDCRRLIVIARVAETE